MSAEKRFDKSKRLLTGFYPVNRTRSSVQDVAGALENVSAGYSSSETMNESFIVSWDGGDDDPLSPRNLSKARKWVIVFVVCTASLCVYGEI